MDVVDRRAFDRNTDGIRPGLVLSAGARRIPIVDLADESCVIETTDPLAVRGYADIFEGDRHVAQCLIVLAAPEDGRIRCTFKRRTAVRVAPPPDFAL